MDGSNAAPGPETYRHIAVTPLSGAVGAEIEGVDAAGPDDATFGELYAAWLRHHVVVLHGQDMTPAQEIAFARRFGEIHHHPYMQGMADHPEIFEILKQPGDTYTIGAAWHTDQMFSPQPAKATVLLAREVPAAGGDTLFANMHLAYDALSDGMKDMLSGLRVWCASDHFGRRGGSAAKREERLKGNAGMAAKLGTADKPQTRTAQPLVRTHPETGRKALYLGAHVVTLEGFEPAEAAPLLDYLHAHSTRPEFTCRVRWRPGTLVIWDNRCLQHYAIPDHNERRRMHRITIAGDTPF